MPQRPVRSSSLVAWLLVILALPACSTGAESTVNWSDTSRDVYVDGELEAGAEVLSATVDGAERLAVLSASAGSAFVVDTDSLEVTERSLDDFETTASGAISSTASKVLASGRVTQVRDRRSVHYLATAGGHTLLISPHQGPVGELETDQLYETAPSWRRRADAYEPDAQAVAALAAHDGPVDVTIAFGTWCGDSRNYVPKLLRAIEAADNPDLQLELVGIGRGFGEPAEHVFGRHLTNVPTVIVSQNGAEIGRIVETPATDTIEADLAAILNRAPVPHQGRWSRAAEIARGRYVYHDADDQPLGDETWELYTTPSGGRLLHSVVTQDERHLEIWHRRDATGGSEFVELTRSHGDEHSRTRIWIDGSELRAVTRGNVTGIVEQNLEVPLGTSFALPCAAEAGYDWFRGDRPGDGSTTHAFELAADLPAAGKLVELRIRPDGEETVTTGHGKVAALRLHADSGESTSRWWLDDELGVPVRGTLADRGRVTLEELTVRSQ